MVFEGQEDSTAILIGFTITNGYATLGGGIYCNQASPQIRNNLITSNAVYYESEALGAGIYLCNDANALVSTNTISNNTSINVGGGIFIMEADPCICRNMIESNIAVSGGGIACRSSNAIISGNSIVDNQSTREGGGCWIASSNPHIVGNAVLSNLSRIGGGLMIIEYSIPIIEGNDIYANQADTAGGIAIYSYSSPMIMDNDISANQALSGGGVYCSGASANILRNEIAANTAAWSDLAIGGGICCVSSDVSILGNIIHANIAEGIYMWGSSCGGGVGGVNSNLILRNNTIDMNTAYCGSIGIATGGGIYLSATDAYLESNVVYLNNSSDEGNGIMCTGGGLDIVNCIIRDNYGDTLDYQISGDCDLVSYCNIQGGWPGEGNIDIDPLFRDPDNANYHLMATICGDPYDSPCIDMGAPTIIDTLLDCDWGLGTERSDMGAYGGGDSASVDIDDIISQLPHQYQLHQNYPNPFNLSTMIKYELPAQSQVTITIYDILGRMVSTLEDAVQPAGYHELIWNAEDLSSGVYFYKLQAGDYVETRKMMLIK